MVQHCTFMLLDKVSGIEIWRIENFRPVPVPKASHGKFFTGDSYVILKVNGLALLNSFSFSLTQMALLCVYNIFYPWIHK